jgi:hypothetical protein
MARWLGREYWTAHRLGPSAGGAAAAGRQALTGVPGPFYGSLLVLDRRP